MTKENKLERTLKDKLINNPVFVSRLKIELLGCFGNNKIISAKEIEETLLKKKFTDSVKEAQYISLELGGGIFNYLGLFSNKLEFIEIKSRRFLKEKEYHVYAFKSRWDYQV